MQEPPSHPAPSPALVQEPPPPAATPPVYDSDDLRVCLKNMAWMHEPRFVEAYAKGMDSGHKICREPGSKTDIHIEWRVHVICWAAWQAAQLAGDFVECGVNTGIFSLAACNYIDFNRTGKSFYLFDTFRGIPLEQITGEERALNREQESDLYYQECFETTKRNFAPYPKAVLVRGKVPDTLETVLIDRVCYLSIDMNIVFPEIAAIRHFWPKLTSGAPVILDDYAWLGYAPQKDAMDEFAESAGCKILSLPTGQGLLIKP